MRHADEPLQCLNLAFLRLNDGLLEGRFALGFKIPDHPQARLNPIANILGHQGHLIDDPLLVAEPCEQRLELLVQPFEPGKAPHALAFVRRLLPLGKLLIHLLVQLARLLDQPAQVL